MPGWYRACQIGRSEQQVHLQHLLHLEFRVDVWLIHSCVQFAVPADWEAPGKWDPSPLTAVTSRPNCLGHRGLLVVYVFMMFAPYSSKLSRVVPPCATVQAGHRLQARHKIRCL